MPAVYIVKNISLEGGSEIPEQSSLTNWLSAMVNVDFIKQENNSKVNSHVHS